MEPTVDLETLIRNVEGKPVSAVEEKVRFRIDAIIDEIFSEDEKHVLTWAYYDAIQQYRDAGQRKLGGPYFLHPDLVLRKALAAGVVDLATLLAALYHDVVEEKIATAIQQEYHARLENDHKLQQISTGKILFSSEEAQQAAYDARKKQLKHAVLRSFTGRKYADPQKRTRKLPSKEQLLIKHHLTELQEGIFEGISSLALPSVSPTPIAHDTTEVVGLLSRQHHEIYYQSMGHVFAPRHKVAPQNIERAITVKFCDRLANMDDLERSTVAVRRRDSIGFDLLITAWDAQTSGDVPLAQELRGRILSQTKEFAMQHPEREDGEFTGDQRLYQCFKNIVLINRYTERELIEKKPISAVSRLHLAQATRQEAQIILNHLCTYHCDDDLLNPEKVYEIYRLHLDYERQGGYKEVTRAGTHIFDGLFQRFFDAKVRGDNAALHVLYDNRYLMCMAALAFRHIADQYLQDPNYFLVGLTQRGLKPHAAIDRRKYRNHTNDPAS